MGLQAGADSRAATGRHSPGEYLRSVLRRGLAVAVQVDAAELSVVVENAQVETKLVKLSDRREYLVFGFYLSPSLDKHTHYLQMPPRYSPVQRGPLLLQHTQQMLNSLC